MHNHKKEIEQTYFGRASMIAAFLSALFLAVFLEISQLHMDPQTFSFWNNITALIYCLLVPITLVLTVIAWRKPKDSSSLAGIAIAVVGIPFLILFVRFLSAVSIR